MAGVSIIVDAMPESEDFATLFARHQAQAPLEIGQVVKGRVIQITAEHVFVDVGGKGEAWIDRAELADDEGRLKITVGDEVEATVVATGDEVRLSHKLRQGAQAREVLALAARSGLTVEGRVAGVIKGGYEVTVAGLRAFCPFSQIDLRRADSEQDYVGRVLEFRVTRYEENGRNIVLSRRQILEAQAAKAAAETRKKIAVDAVLPGTIVSLADFGAFVDLGGVQGLVPMSELSHARVARAGDRLRLGEAVTVKVIRVDEAKGKVTLSLKALEGDPWTAVAGRLRERQVVRGRAVRAAEFGVFVELLPGVDGLLHASEIPRHRAAELREAVAAQAEIAVMILTIEAGKRRVGLALAPEGVAVGQELASTVAVGAVLIGVVDRVESFGVLVRLGPGQTGLVPNAELGTSRGADHRKMFPAGSELKVMVLAIEDGGRRIRLSRDKALAHEEQAETQAYMKDAGDKRGFGMTLGDALNQARKR
jgi:small subunit ribosomal protein S1